LPQSLVVFNERYPDGLGRRASARVAEIFFPAALKSNKSAFSGHRPAPQTFAAARVREKLPLTHGIKQFDFRSLRHAFGSLQQRRRLHM